MMGLLTGISHFKGHILKLGLVTVPGMTDAERHWKWPHMFFVTVRNWQY